MDKGLDKIEDKQGMIDNEQMIRGVVDQIVDSVCVKCRNGSEENLNINHNEEVREDNLRTKCTFPKKGICNAHGTPSTKISIPSQKWKDRGVAEALDG